MISVENLVKTYRSGNSTVPALDGVDLTVREGEIFGVVGQSGAGKSTLVRTINLLERPDSGRVVVDGQDLTALDDRALRSARQRIGMVFQHFNLLSNRSVRGNVELSLEIRGADRRERRSRASEILDLVGLAGREDAYPGQLSGGQKQRVGIARALATNPSVLLSDEATSALDPETTRSILDLIKRLNRELGLTVLLITHEMDVVKRVCDSAALLSGGRVVERGRIHELLGTEGSRIAAELFPLGAHAPARGNSVIDITFAGLASERPVIAALVRRHNIDVSILGAALETIGDEQTGRIRLELPGGTDRNRAAIADLRGQGYLVEVVDGGVR